MWRWRFESADGGAATGPSGDSSAGGFPTQSDAESWLGESWRELLDAGVAQVTLFDDDRSVYGPMGLAPA